MFFLASQCIYIYLKYTQKVSISLLVFINILNYLYINQKNNYEK